MVGVPAEPPKLFGAYVTNVSASMGWGGEGGSCQLTLLEDPDTGVVIPKFDDAGNRDNVNGKPFTGDSKFSPIVGTAVGFAYGDFYAAGIFQRYSYKDSLSGRTYDIVLESPSKLLDGIEIILEGYEGTTYDGTNPGAPYEGIIFNRNYDDFINNIWNPFAELENYVADVPKDNDGIGPLDSHFGKADVNSAGFPVITLLEQLARFGRDEGLFGGKAVFGDTSYFFDFSELIDAVSEIAPQYRVKGPKQTLNGILADICDVIQFDYFAQILGSVDEDGNRETNQIQEATIKIRLCNKGDQPDPGMVQSLVDDWRETGTLISSNIGKEQQDTVTQRLVVGGAASRYYNAGVWNHDLEQGDFYTFPVWGKDANNNYYLGSGPIATTHSSWNSYVTVMYPSTGEQQQRRYALPNAGQQYTAWLFELRMALAGQAAWETFKVFQTAAGLEPNGFYLGTENDPAGNAPWVSANELSLTVLNHLLNYRTDAMDLCATSVHNAYWRYQNDGKQFSKDLYDSVYKVASEYYGQVFFTPLPFEPGGQRNNLRFINEDIQYEAAWEISESAWLEDKPVGDVTFYDGDGRFKSVAKYPLKPNSSRFGNNYLADYSNMGADYGFGDSNIYTTKGGADKDLYWIHGNPWALIRTNCQIREYDALTTQDFGITILSQMFFNDGEIGPGIDVMVPPAAYITPGKEPTTVPIPPAVMLPTSIGIPQQSTRYKWGPWYAYSSKKGKAEVVMDESLRPETFGSLETLDLVAKATTYMGLPQMAAVESGSVELAEFPAYNIGDRFGAAGSDDGTGPYITNMSISIGTDGCKTTYKFNTWTPNFGKLAKYNIDRISRINKANWAFIQRERGKVQKRPFPKINFQRANFSNDAFRWASQGFEVMVGLFRNRFPF